MPRRPCTGGPPVGQEGTIKGLCGDSMPDSGALKRFRELLRDPQRLSSPRGEQPPILGEAGNKGGTRGELGGDGTRAIEGTCVLRDTEV
mmetsp:Transcript_12548/g.34705  ORF Transcript_12548/g.34705 Transcript_12548/m.34705 type:complete len:89 (-) Transcript_12548:95-361(-)